MFGVLSCTTNLTGFRCHNLSNSFTLFMEIKPVYQKIIFFQEGTAIKRRPANGECGVSAFINVCGIEACMSYSNFNK